MVTPEAGAAEARSPCCCGLSAKLSQLFSPSPSKCSRIEGEALMKELLISNPLPGVLKVGSHIKVVGTPIAEAPWWCVNVGAAECSNDGNSPEVVLQLTVRMPRQFAARNTRYNAVWGTDETTSLCTFPFVRNVQFVLEILFAEEEALLAVDGVLFARYKLRTPGMEAAKWVQTIGLRKPTVVVSAVTTFPQLHRDYPVVPYRKASLTAGSDESKAGKPDKGGLKPKGGSLGSLGGLLDKVKKISNQDIGKGSSKEKKNSADRKKDSADQNKSSQDAGQSTAKEKKTSAKQKNSADSALNGKDSLDGKNKALDGKENSVENDLVMLKEEQDLSDESVPVNALDTQDRERKNVAFGVPQPAASEPSAEELFQKVMAPNSSYVWWGHNMCAIISNGIPQGYQLVTKIRLRPMVHSFKIQLTDGVQEWPMANVMLEVNPRPFLRPFGSCQPIVFNSCEAGKYGVERRQCTGHMVPGTKVIVRIVRGESDWAVWADNTLLGELDYRLAPDLVKAVRLRGDVMPLDMYIEPASATVLA